MIELMGNLQTINKINTFKWRTCKVYLKLKYYCERDKIVCWYVISTIKNLPITDENSQQWVINKHSFSFPSGVFKVEQQYQIQNKFWLPYFLKTNIKKMNMKKVTKRKTGFSFRYFFERNCIICLFMLWLLYFYFCFKTHQQHNNKITTT